MQGLQQVTLACGLSDEIPALMCAPSNNMDFIDIIVDINFHGWKFLSQP